MGILDKIGYNPNVNQSSSLLASLGSYAPVAESYGMSMVPPNGMPSMDGASGGSWLGDFGKLWGGSKDAAGNVTNGIGGTILGIAQGLGNAYMGMQQFGLAKKALKQSKEQFDMNYAAQKKTTNASLEDRQRARVASNAGAYESVGSYMQKNGIA